MHREILTSSYSLDCTELSKAMQTGHFNCVSATVLFNVLAEKAGLDVYALEMPGHALSRVRFPDGGVMDIETTAPTWFAMQTDQERRQATLERIVPALAATSPATAQNAVAPPAVIAETELSANLREISAVQLVATIYYNIGVGLHAKKHYPEAAAANIKVLYLDKENGKAWTNLIASLNNWALNLADERNGRQYDKAITILDRGVVLDPTYDGFRTNQTFVLYHWIYGLAMKGLFDDARQTYVGVQTRRLDNESFQKLMSDVDLAEKNIQQQRALSQQRR
jgi:tetratricopeptide (TPR) repeat protein